MTMTFGIHLGHLGGPMPEMRRVWKFADARGFDWFSVSDHFQESPPQGGDGDCFEAVTTLTAAALETTRVRLGCLVFCVNYRNPGLLAKSLTTIDHLSGGRVECGIGAGWHAVEYGAFGIPFDRIGVREDQLEEYAQILRRLFEEKVSNFAGRHFRLHEARNYPKPLQPRVRIWIRRRRGEADAPRGGAVRRRLERALSGAGRVEAEERRPRRLVPQGRPGPEGSSPDRQRRLLPWGRRPRRGARRGALSEPLR